MPKLERNVVASVELSPQSEEHILNYFIKYGHLASDKACSATPNTKGNVTDNARRLYLRALMRTDRRQQKEVSEDRDKQRELNKETKRQAYLASLQDGDQKDESPSERIRVEASCAEAPKTAVQVVSRNTSCDELLRIIRSKLQLPIRYNTLTHAESGEILRDLTACSKSLHVCISAVSVAQLEEQQQQQEVVMRIDDIELEEKSSSDSDDDYYSDPMPVLHLPPLLLDTHEAEKSQVGPDIAIVHDDDNETSDLVITAAAADDLAAPEAEDDAPLDSCALPIHAARNDIMNAVAQNQCVVIVGETGSGKTTQIPQYMLSQSCHQKPLVLITQPRRLAAISVAHRVASELHCVIGSRVGYHVRHQHAFDECKSATTEVLFVTTGILLRYLQDPSTLSRLTHLIIDEVHERQVETDLVLTLLKHQLPLHPHLKLLVLSATMDSAAMSLYLNSCPVIAVPGRSYPVDIKYFRDATALTQRYSSTSRSAVTIEKEAEDVTPPTTDSFDANMLAEFLVSLMKFCDSCANTDDEEPQPLNIVLVFLPGLKTIEDTAQSLRRMCNDQLQQQIIQICLLHSSFPLSTQRAIYRPPPSVVCRHRIVLSTNIAESSLTVPGVIHVVDAGLVRQMDFDPSIETSTLHTTAASLASLKQRAGRAGRTQPGVCWRLFTEASLPCIPAFTPPEMRRVPLEDVVLKVLMLGFGEFGDCPYAFLGSCPDPPSNKQIEQALSRLLQMQAIFPTSGLSGKYQRFGLTSLGFTLAQLPVDARLGYLLLLGCVLDRIEATLTIAAVLADQSPLLSPIGKHAQATTAHKQLLNSFYNHLSTPSEDRVTSDHIMALAAYTMWEKQDGPTHEFCRNNYLSLSTLVEMKKLRTLYRSHLIRHNLLRNNSGVDRDVLVDSVFRYVLCAGLFPHVARLSRGPAVQPKPPKHARGKGGGKTKTPINLATVFLDKYSSNISFHPCSILSGRVKEVLDRAESVGEVKNVYFAYFRKVASPPASVQLYDATEVSPTMLLLCGHSMSYDRKSRAKCRVMMDNWIELKVSETHAVLMRALQGEILELFRLKLAAVSEDNFLNDRQEQLIELLKCIF